jgi:hypothetical protein
MREQVIQVVGQYIEAVRHNDASALPLHPDAICEFRRARIEARHRSGRDSKTSHSIPIPCTAQPIMLKRGS